MSFFLTDCLDAGALKVSLNFGCYCGNIDYIYNYC